MSNNTTKLLVTDNDIIHSRSSSALSFLISLLITGLDCILWTFSVITTKIFIIFIIIGAIIFLTAILFMLDAIALSLANLNQKL